MRRIDVRSGPPGPVDADMLAVLLPHEARLEELRAIIDERLVRALDHLLTSGGFRPDPNATELIASDRPAVPHLLAVGAGELSGVHADAVRQMAGVAMRAARAKRQTSLALLVDPRIGERVSWPAAAQAAAEGLMLGDWSFDDLRGEAGREKLNPLPERAVVLIPVVSSGAEAAVLRGRTLADAQNYARGLVTRPGNVATPTYLSIQAEQLGERSGLQVQSWGPDRLRELGFGAILAVARGSEQEPRFILLEHAGADEPPFVLIGKGVTFDAGGLSLKPAAGMADMKYDMAGAAAVLGALRAAAELGLARRVVGLIPATENLPSGRAIKPGDVIRGLAGISIEVDNTDAEGRLILSDAIAYANRLQPQAVIDVATLTGACVIALGHHAIGMMSPNDDLAAALTTAGEQTGERVWRLPLWPEYRKQLDSSIADIKNTGGRPASTITAGLFLKEFVGDYPWGHLDIAGTAWTEDELPYHPKGATGIGVRLLIEWLNAAG